MNCRCLGWVLLALLSFVHATDGQAAAPTPEAGIPPLVTTADIQAMAADAAAKEPPVRVQGVVTFSHERSRTMFVEDRSGGIYCDVSRISLLPPVGRRIEVDGVVRPGAYVPILQIKSLKDLGPGELPSPRAISNDELWSGRFDGDFVRVQGQALLPHYDALPTGHWVVPLKADGRDLFVILLSQQMNQADVTNLYGSYISVDGVYGATANEKRQVVTANIAVASNSWLRVMTNAADMARLTPLTSLGQLLDASHFAKPNYIRTEGIVCSTASNVFFIAGNGGGIRVSDNTNLDLKVGYHVEVYGIATGYRPERRMQMVKMISFRPGQPPAPTEIRAGELFNITNTGRRVTVTGEFLHRVPRSPGNSVYLRQDDQTFEARLAYDDADATVALRAGSEIRVTGLLWYFDSANATAPIQPRLIVNSPRDFAVVSRPPWPMRITLLVLSVLAGALGFGLLALIFAHHRLKAYSRKIKETDGELRQLNADLETRIRERTAELERANGELSREVAERIDAQKTLSVREGNLRTLVEGVNAVVWEFALAANRFTYVSPQAAQFGYPIEEWFKPNFWQDHIHPEDRDAAIGFCLTETEKNSSHEFQYRFLTADGGYVWLDDKVNVHVQSGGAKMLRGVLIDITERRQREAALRESEERFAKAFHASPVITVITRMSDACYLDVNEQFTATLGYSREETLGRTSLELGIWVEPRRRQEMVDALENGRQIRDWECEFRGKGGDVHTMLLSVERINVRGEPCLLGINHDITNRKIAERLRDEQNAVLEMIAQGAPLGLTLERLARAIESQSEGMRCSVLVFDRENQRLLHGAAPSLPEEYNQAIHGLTIGPGVGSCGTAAYAKEQVIVEDIETDSRWTNFRDLARRADLRACWSTPILDAQQQLLGTFAVYYSQPRRPDTRAQVILATATHTAAICIKSAADAAALSETARTLRHQNQLLQSMGQLAQIGAWSIDLRTKVLTWSRQTYAIHELDPAIKPDIAIGLSFYAPEARPIITAAVEAGLRDGTPWDLELPFITAKDRKIWVRTLGQLELEDGKPVRLAGAFQDITVRKQTEQALRTSEERFQLAMRGANDGLWDWNLKTDDCYYSPRWKSMLGYGDTELAANLETWKNLTSPDDTERVLNDVKSVIEGSAETFQSEFRMRHKDGHWVNILSRAFLVRDDSGTPARLVGTHLDITERKRSEELQRNLEIQLRQSQKMEAIGTLAGGVAHDFNNLLGAIIGCAELARMDCATNIPAVENLNDLLKASHRAKDLVRQILTFSRQQPQARSIIPLRPIIEESFRLLRAALPANVELSAHLDSQASPVLADAGLIQQVIMNLVTNAAQAIGGRPGRVDISLKNVEPDAALRAQHPTLRPGPYVLLQVRDNGSGMDPATIARIFEPFFTTKGPGHGTGLGLSVVHGIVRNHDGCIGVQSEPSVGSTFSVYLPAAGAVNEPAVPASRAVGLPTGHERILLVDDELALLRVEEKILRNAGYNVTACSNPIEALEIFRQSPSAFNLVITDYAMPGQTGDNLAREILAIRPGLPILICTGNTTHLTRDQARQLGFRDLLQKPVEISQICRAVRQAIDSSTPLRQP